MTVEESREIKDLKLKVTDMEKDIVSMGKSIVALDTKAEERNTVTNNKLDDINGKVSQHIDIHIRREDAELAAVKAKADELQMAAVDDSKSFKEKLFYPLILLLTSGFIGLATALLTGLIQLKAGG